MSGTPPADKREPSSSAVCGIEAEQLLNCVTHKNYDREKCIKLLEKLRACVKENVGPSLAPA